MIKKPLFWMQRDIKTPPFSIEARLEAGVLLRRLQYGEMLSMPHSRPMPSIGVSTHELRINDGQQTWRIVYAIHEVAIVILCVFPKTTRETPKSVIKLCQVRLTDFISILNKE